MHTRRIDHVTVVTPDSPAALSTFQDSFGFAKAPPTGTVSGPTMGAVSALQIGSARIEFVTPAPGTALAAVFAASGQGMAELCLEVASLDEAAQTLDRARVPYASDRSSGQRVVRIDPSAAHGVHLSLVERG
jgi:catechol 2,3-dioxygenase-like lactoylglutathione lyase family enzyme